MINGQYFDGKTVLKLGPVRKRPSSTSFNLRNNFADFKNSPLCL